MSSGNADRPDDREIARRGLSALVVAVVAVALVVSAARVLDVAPGFDPFGYGPSTLFTVIGVVGATLVYAVLWRVVADPDRTFTLVAGAVLVVSWVPDVVVAPALPGATTGGVLVLAFLHLVVAVVAVGFLTERIP
ncbi:DUF6069 family protein [Halorarius halobius]|uniref:DUF6069 family protein n=1 Tax=Halorarius halobius TaxID=2962671 RepID=UPI0020CDBF8D|nr:DUF6069 family protein [Halorarius halobius]